MFIWSASGWYASYWNAFLLYASRNSQGTTVYTHLRLCLLGRMCDYFHVGDGNVSMRRTPCHPCASLETAIWSAIRCQSTAAQTCLLSTSYAYPIIQSHDQLLGNMARPYIPMPFERFTLSPTFTTRKMRLSAFVEITFPSSSMFWILRA